MELEHYQIPDSYKSTIEKFGTDPEAAITSLQNRIEKRNAGAIGYFFLAWLYIKKNDIDNAIEAAWQARVRAPGSEFIHRLHYFIEHPSRFEAWQPQFQTSVFSRDMPEATFTHPIQDLDTLITRLSSVETTKLRIESDKTNDQDLSEKSSNVDDIVTETLAVIHEKQENYTAAITTYQRLIHINPEREEYFKKQIDRLKKNITFKNGKD
jgi:tetratricopeptide (TPR) repeat protein